MITSHSSFSGFKIRLNLFFQAVCVKKIRPSCPEEWNKNEVSTQYLEYVRMNGIELMKALSTLSMSRRME